MASGFEPVPLTSQKHDPAWKHCQMFKNGDRVQLKCLYCGKIFKGGGIHRIKEHLAGQKGNASTCLRVLPDVRLLMQESLNCVVVKKRKKQKIADELSNFNPTTSEIDPFTNQCGLNTEVTLIAVPETIEPNATFLVSREEETSNKGGGRKKKGRVRKASRSATPNALAVNNSIVVGSKRVNNQVSVAIGRFFYDVGIPLDAVKSEFFQPMVDAIASQGTGVVAPSYHDLRSSILKNSLQEVRSDIDQCVGTWGKTGCSVLVDEWISEKGRTLVNFLLYCPEGMTFLRSVDISDIVNIPDALYELLKEVVEEVGMRNVLQVVTNAEERYAVAAKRLTDALPTVFWTPCAAHCIDLILEDIKKLEWINTIFEQAKSVSRFIYNHSVVLNMMRRYTFGVDLVDIGATRITTDFMTLKRMVNIKHNLQSMVTSEEWMECSYSKKPEGFAMLDLISSQSFWSSCITIVHLTDPLLRLLRLVCSEKKPAMGYVYAGIYRAKESIKKQLINKKDYLVYWNVIDHRWEQLQRHPLHAAGFYLNPKFFYSIEGDVHHQIRSSVYDCIEKLVPDLKIQDKIVKETTSYHNAVGDFGRKMAIRSRDTLLPDEWWSTYGGGCPNLARLAIRILSQTCSLIACKPNWVTIQQMHETKNCLEHQRLSDLVFVHYNLQLRQMARKDKEQDAADPISFENVGIVGDWVIEKEGCLEDFGSPDWMSVDPPLGNTTLLGPTTDDVEDLGAGFGDYEIFEGVRDGEEENVEDNIVSQ
ncbi:Spore coat protein like [Actinidia chinensis var. chinensis]|uniref:Spore coat protein like n=1 Tax=Actinidia chinensis var. chinensis TaxID=1590841 RepID=A0A2R6PLD0_ACTCC|nr:Spore coat protein like [Actinidia chinensis var. chinensis]